ncbi:3-hydroxyisobutyrate dehydrogenase [Acetobacter oeni LMG 21952]|nr:L-threonate dehydrogenase [Acetobacter oeni]NHO19863.1 NAD-binding protein [Acetobacter oeni]GBR10426.1 3-hydroxyisobutyrate dehydrogenase [Acetobacter oeni LMG 21952]
MSNNKKIGVIGLGAMGAGVALSLLRRGFTVHAADTRREALDRFAEAGGVPAADPAALGAECDVILVQVVNAAQTEQVLFGEKGAVSTLKPGSLVIGCATVSPEFAESVDARLHNAGLFFLDAPMSGGAAKAASGEMTLMTSGAPEAQALAADILPAIAGTVYRVGDRAGTGSKIKIVNQLLAGVHIAAAAEAMALAIREGGDPRTAYEIITNSAGNSWMFENRVPHILSGDYTPLSAVDIFVKDLGLVLDTGGRTKFPLPLAAAAHQQFLAASAAGFGREDDSAVIKMFPGIDLPHAGQTGR